MVANEIEGLCTLLLHVPEFAESLKFRPLPRRIRRVKTAGSKVPALPVISDAEFQAKIVAEGNEAAEYMEIPHKPGRDYQCKTQYRR
jgi:hypothetical protein